MRVLLIEDSEEDVALLRALLEDLPGHRADGAQVAAAGTLSDALLLLDRDSPDVVLLDLNLPDSVGLDTLEAVRRRAPGLPVVIMSGLADEAGAAEAVRRGAQDYLFKDEVTSEVLWRSCAAPRNGRARGRTDALSNRR